MEYLTELRACLQSTGTNFAVALVCIFFLVLVAYTAREHSTCLIAFLLLCVTVWRVVVWMIDFVACF